jgi:hypothetical protein
MAKHLSISTSQKKEALVDAIRDKVKRKKILDEELIEKEGSFLKDQNTFPRLCIILMQFPDALERSNLLSTRNQLQNKEINESQPIFVNAAEHFNDARHNSGGLVELDGANHDILIEKILTLKQLTNLVKLIIKEFIQPSNRYAHNMHIFLLNLMRLENITTTISGIISKETSIYIYLKLL